MSLDIELVRLSSILGGDATSMPYSRELLDWVDGYLARPHVDLGRDGPVCPFARAMLDRELLWVGTITGPNPDVDEVVDAFGELARTLRSSSPTRGPHALLKALVITFPDVVDTTVIETIQQRLKPHFVADGLMVGQFYAGCTASGLWNDDFRPLQSPVPLIAVRSMVSSDFPFLNSDPSWIAAYLRHFAPTVPSAVRAALSGGFVPQRA